MRAGLISPEEAKESRFRNIITRSVGFEPSVEPDLQGLSVQAGDCFVLCSDGLSNYLTVEELAQVLTGHCYRDVPTVFIDLANERGGDDNVTCLAIYAGNEDGVSAVPGSLIVVHVHAHVMPDAVEAFRAASIENARESVREPGVARFDVVQSTEDPTRFVLVEVYRTADAPAAHKATAHYARWRDAVADLMAEPRTSVKYVNVAPEDAGW